MAFATTSKPEITGIHVASIIGSDLSDRSSVFARLGELAHNARYLLMQFDTDSGIFRILVTGLSLKHNETILLGIQDTEESKAYPTSLVDHYVVIDHVDHKSSSVHKITDESRKMLYRSPDLATITFA